MLSLLNQQTNLVLLTFCVLNFVTSDAIHNFKPSNQRSESLKGKGWIEIEIAKRIEVKKVVRKN